MNIKLPEEIKSSAIKRQAEYITGGYAIRSAFSY